MLGKKLQLISDSNLCFMFLSNNLKQAHTRGVVFSMIIIRYQSTTRDTFQSNADNFFLSCKEGRHARRHSMISSRVFRFIEFKPLLF